MRDQTENSWRREHQLLQGLGHSKVIGATSGRAEKRQEAEKVGKRQKEGNVKGQARADERENSKSRQIKSGAGERQPATGDI